MKNPIPRAALDDRLGFIGTSGSGKTYSAGVAVETLLALQKARVVIVDPLGVWWGLRLLADGKTQSRFEVAIFGGDHGDLPLTEHAGALIGETAATMAESCIIDLSALRGKSAERRFMTAFLDTIYLKATKEPFHLIVDEADLFAPQKPASGAETLLGHMEDIVRRGRVKGFIPWLISQRPAVINKNVLSQVDGLIAFRLTATQDRDALDDWIEGQADKTQGKEIKSSLPTLHTGEGVVWLPGHGILTTAQFPAKVTFDSSRTPKRGEKVKSRKLKPLNVDTLKGKLATVEAEAKANNPTALRTEIAKLKAEKAKLEGQVATAKPVADKAALLAAEIRGFDKAKKKFGPATQKALNKAIAGAIALLSGRLNHLTDDVRRDLKELVVGLPGLEAELTFDPLAPTVVPAVPRLVPRVAPQATPRARPAAPKPVEGHATLTKPQLEVLRSLAWWAAMGHQQPTRVQVAAIAGWTPKGSNLRGRLSELSSAGLIAYPTQGTVQLTDAGAGVAPQPETGTGLMDSIRNALTVPQQTLFDVLVRYRDGGGMSEMPREDLAREVGWEPGGSNLRGRLSELSSLEVISYPSRGTVALQDWVQDMRLAA